MSFTTSSASSRDNPRTRTYFKKSTRCALWKAMNSCERSRLFGAVAVDKGHELTATPPKTQMHDVRGQSTVAGLVTGHLP